MEEITTQDPHMAEALARYAVIAPVVSRKLTHKERVEELKRLARCTHVFPEGERQVSIRNVRRWVHWYQHGRPLASRVIEAGVGALRPIPRKDQGEPRKVDRKWILRAEALRREEPGRTTATLIELLRAEAVADGLEAPDIEEATLAHHLRKLGATRQAVREEGRVYPRYEHNHRNAVWQCDFSQGIQLPNPTRPGEWLWTHLHVIEDDHTRFVPHGEFHWRQNVPALQNCFQKAVVKGGKCAVAYWDNGPAYQARQINLMAARLGIQVVFATPYHPMGKGKVERFFRTVQESFYPEARRSNIQTLEELNTFFWAWLERYHDTLHSETRQTPRERWEAGADQVEWIDPASLVDIFLWEEVRKVDKSGCVHIEGNAYPVAEHLVNQKVSVRFDPFDLSTARIYSKGRLVCTATPQTLVSHTYRKAQPRRPERPGPLDSATLYRKQLSEGYRQEVSAVLSQGRPPKHDTDCLTRPELAAVFVEMLGRSLTVQEGTMVADFFVKYAPFPSRMVRSALQFALEDKGTDRHLRFYLDAVKQARRGGEAAP
jgi:transposase InsO family protein